MRLAGQFSVGVNTATPAEVRNCLIIMKDPKFFDWLDSMVNYQSFVDATPLTEKQQDEQYRFELLVRYLVLQATPPEEARAIDDLETYLNDKILEMAESTTLDRTKSQADFQETFDRLYQSAEDNAFRRLNTDKNKYVGPFLLSAFEVIAIGVASNLPTIRQHDGTWLVDRIVKLWQENLLKSVGLRSSQRLAITLPLARDHFSET